MIGQYLAVESILTIVMGITLSAGTVAILTTYQEDLNDSGKEKGIEVVSLKLEKALYSLENSYSGSQEVDLPEKIGGQDYTVALDKGVRVFSGSENKTSKLRNFREYDMRGTAEGGTVVVSKNGDEFRLRS